MNLKQLLNEDKQAIVSEFENLIKNQEKIKKHFLDFKIWSQWFELKSNDDISVIKKLIKDSNQYWNIVNNYNGIEITFCVEIEKSNILLNDNGFIPSKVNYNVDKYIKDFFKNYKNTFKYANIIVSKHKNILMALFGFKGEEFVNYFKADIPHHYDRKNFDKIPKYNKKSDKIEQPQKYKISYELNVKSPYNHDYDSKIFTGTEKEAKAAARDWALSIIKKHKNYYNDKIKEGNDSFRIEASYGDEEISASIYYYYKKA